VQRPGGRCDGCATFWDPRFLTPVKVDRISMDAHRLKDNVALLMLLQPVSQPGAEGHKGQAPSPAAAAALPSFSSSSSFHGGPGQPATGGSSGQGSGAAAAAVGVAPGASDLGAQVLVANTHVLFNPKRGDVKLGQLRVILDR
jgi:hypothetical protein